MGTPRHAQGPIRRSRPAAKPLGAVLAAGLALLGAGLLPAASAAAADAPTVTSVSPAGGSTSGGSIVTILGANMLGATAVTFGTTNSGGIFYASASEVIALSPAGTGTVDVTVTTPDGTSGTSAADRFTYTSAPQPVVTSITPTTTSAGNTIQINGSGLSGATAVEFGSTPSPSFSFPADTIGTAEVPPGSGTVMVTVVGPGGTSYGSAAAQFSYPAGPPPAPPTVTSLSPSSGPTPGGGPVTISGSGFLDANLIPDVSGVSFGGVGATYSVDGAGSLTATVPAAASVGTVDVTVTTPLGTSAISAADQYTYTAPPAPTITGLSVASGPVPGRIPVTILGTNLRGATAVTFGGTAALPPYTASDDGTSLQVEAPASCRTGAVAVSVTTPGGTSAQSVSFSYTAEAAPTVTGIAPATGPAAGHTTVTVTGTNFECSTLFFGTAEAPIFIPVGAGSATAVSPAGSGVVDVTATNTGGASAAVPADEFTYQAAIPPLTIGTTSLPSGEVGSSYDQQLAATGGTAPYTWALATGTLPDGLRLSADGAITGAPTAAGTSTFTVQAKDSLGATATKTLSVDVNPQLAVTTTQLPDATVGEPYAATLAASGGSSGPRTWTLAEGKLPDGLALSGDGTISGSPTTPGTSTFTVSVDDPATATLSITVDPATTTAPPSSGGSSSSEPPSTGSSSSSEPPSTTPTASATPSPSAAGPTDTSPPAGATQQSASSAGTPGSGALASTGNSARSLTVLGVGIVLVGGIAALVGRRRVRR